MSTKKEENALVVKESGALPAAMLDDMEELAGAGSENVTIEDVARPALTLLQKMSPQVDETEAKFIKGAKPGMILKGDTNELFDGKVGILFVPCAYDRQFIQWKPRSAGGGIVSTHGVHDPLVEQIVWDSENKPVLPNGNLLVDTRDHFGMLLNEATGAAEPVIISMSSTGVKVSKKLNSTIKSIKMQGKNGFFNPPSFANIFRLKAAQQSNDQGSWYIWSFEHHAFTASAELFENAKQFREMVLAGQVKVDREDTDAGVIDTSATAALGDGDTPEF